jgi:hypothetical protein
MRTHGFGDAKVGAVILLDVSRPLRALAPSAKRQVTVTSKVDRQDRSYHQSQGIAPITASNNLRSMPSIKERYAMTSILRVTTPKTKASCETCKGSFGLIRHRFAHKQFCSKQCLNQYLNNKKQRVIGFGQWIDFSRNH